MQKPLTKATTLAHTSLSSLMLAQDINPDALKVNAAQACPQWFFEAHADHPPLHS